MANALLKTTLRELEHVSISTLTFSEYSRIKSHLNDVVELDKAGSLKDPALSKLKEKINPLMTAFFKETGALSAWCNQRIETIQRAAEQKKDTTLLKMVEIADDLESQLTRLKIAKGPFFEFRFPSRLHSCELTAFGAGQAFTSLTPENVLHLLYGHNSLRTITNSTDFLRSELGQDKENLFICGFRGPTASQLSCIDHWLILNEKQIDGAFKYRIFCSYINHYDLRQYLALHPVETEKGIWISKEALFDLLNWIDQFIQLPWTPEKTAKHLELFGAGHLKLREKENFTTTGPQEVHVININKVRKANEQFNQQLRLVVTVAVVAFIAFHFFK